MKMKIKATDVELTSEMRQRVEWICEKLEKIMAPRERGTLECDVAIVQTSGDDHGTRQFRAEIYLSGPEIALGAFATAESAMVALDIAHDEIERKFFQLQRTVRMDEKIKSFAHKQAVEGEEIKAAKKKKAEEDRWWIKRRKSSDEG